MQLEDIIAEGNDKNRKAKWDAIFDHNVYCLVIFMAFIIVMMLSGCTKKAMSLRYLETKAELWTEVVPQAEANRYEVRLKWRQTQGYPPKGWFIRRMEIKTGSERAVYREARTTSFNDESVEAGCSYRYTLGAIEDVEGSVVKTETQIYIPKTGVAATARFDERRGR